MSSFRAFFPLLVLLLSLGACATTVPVKRPSDSASVTPQADVEANLPAVELTADVLYDLLVADLAVQRKQYELAIDNYLQLAQTTGDPRMAGMAARVAIYSRNNAMALKAARLWVELDDSDPEARQAVIAAYIRNGQPDAALSQIDALLNMPDGAENSMSLLASLLSREQDVQAALTVMKHVLEARGDNPDVLLAYGHLALRSGNLAGALTVIDKVLQIQPYWTDALLLKARILQLQGKLDEARQLMASAVKDQHDDIGLRLAYARLLMDERRYEEALVQYQFLSTLSPENSELKYTLGLLLLQLKRYDEAASQLESIRRRGERFDDVNFYLGWIAENRGDASAAIDYYSAVTRGSNYLEASLRMATLLAAEGELEIAREQLQDLRTETPTHGQRIYLVEGEILRDAGRDEEALTLFSEAVEAFPTDIGLRYARAMMAEHIGRLDLMERDLHQILEQDIDNVDALNALGYTLADRTERYEEAYGYIKRALELRPDNNAILDSMGWVLYRMGNYEEAIKYLRLSLKLKMDYEVAAHLGEVLWVSGRHEEALEIWNQALEQFSGNKILLDVIKRFSH